MSDDGYLATTIIMPDDRVDVIGETESDKLSEENLHGNEEAYERESHARLCALIYDNNSYWNIFSRMDAPRRKLIIDHTLSVTSFSHFLEEQKIPQVLDLFFHFGTVSEGCIDVKDRPVVIKFFHALLHLLRAHPRENIHIIMQTPIPLCVAVDQYDEEEPYLLRILTEGEPDLEQLLFFMEECQNVIVYEGHLREKFLDKRKAEECARLTGRFKELMKDFPLTSLTGKVESIIAEHRYYYALKYILESETSVKLLQEDIVDCIVQAPPKIVGGEDMRVLMLEALAEKGYPPRTV